MKKRYFVWKNANCNGVNPEWIELSGKEFYEFQKKVENKTRYFATLAHPELDDVCYVMECTFEDYLKNHKENCETYYKYGLKKKAKITEVSYYSKVTDSSLLTYEDVIPDENENVEENAIKSIQIEKINMAITKLPLDEQAILQALYFQNEDGKSERQIAKELSKYSMTLNRQHKRIKEKLKKSLLQN